MRRPRGLTLIELLTSMFTFGLLLGAVFLLFGVSSRGFRTVDARQTAQNQLAAIRAALQQDLQVTHFYGMSLDTRGRFAVGDKSYPRHALSAVALSSWDNPARRDSFGTPIWDRWVVYRVTPEQRGRLLRHMVTPVSGDGRQLLRPADGLALLAQSATTYDPSWSRISPPRTLAQGVRSLEMALDQELRGINLAVTIEQKSDPRNPRNDVMTATFFVKPHNTVPTD